MHLIKLVSDNENINISRYISNIGYVKKYDIIYHLKLFKRNNTYILRKICNEIENVFDTGIIKDSLSNQIGEISYSPFKLKFNLSEKIKKGKIKCI